MSNRLTYPRFSGQRIDGISKLIIMCDMDDYATDTDDTVEQAQRVQALFDAKNLPRHERVQVLVKLLTDLGVIIIYNDAEFEKQKN